MKFTPITGFISVAAITGVLIGWISFAPIEQSQAPIADVIITPETVVVDPKTSVPGDSAPEAMTEPNEKAVVHELSALLSHQAIYKISLKSATDSSGISGISGEMSFTFRDQCDGWTVENNSLLNIQYSQGAGMTHRQSFVTWESKDGQEYRFRVRRFMDDRLTDDIRGEASMPGDVTPQAVFTKPEDAAIDLEKGVRFPSGYLRDLLTAANSGETILSRQVFEGDEVDQPYLVSAVISPAKGKVSPLIAEVDGLPDAKAWTFRLAYFRSDNRSPEPEFELRLVYREDGIADKIIQDFGDYALSFELVELEPLTKPDC